MLFVPPFIPAEAQSEPYMGAIVELDKAVYSWTDVVWIYISAPNFNSDPTDIDYIGCGASIHLIGDKNECSQSLITITPTNVVNNVSMPIEKLDYFVLEECRGIPGAMLAFKAFYPLAVLLLPVVLTAKAALPNA